MLANKSTQLASWILYLFVFTVFAQSGCNHDDCYNALFPCDSLLALTEAVDYCSTVGAYGATNYPARATSACGTKNKLAYISACACGVACPSPTPPTASTTILPVPTTLTTSVAVSGGTASLSSGSFISVSSIGNTSTGASTSTVSSTIDSESSISVTSSSSAATATSSSGGHPTPQGPASDVSTTASNPVSSLTLSLTKSASTTTHQITSSVSDPVSVPFNFTSASSRTRPSSSGVLSSALSSTFASGGTGMATAPSGSVQSSSARWTNTSCVSGAVPISSTDPATASATTFDPPSTSDLPSTHVSPSMDPVSASSTIFPGGQSTFPASPDPNFPGTITASGGYSSDTTCAPTPKWTASHHSSAYYYFNSTFRATPSSIRGILSAFTSRALSSTSASTSLDYTSDTQSASMTASAGPSCTSISSAESIENGDFEHGLSPWSVDLVDIMSTSYSVANPGANGSCAAFHVAMRRNSQSEDLRSNLRLVSPMVSLPPARSRWAVSFWVRFGSRSDASYLNLYANYAVAHRVDAVSANWTRAEFEYTAGNERILQLVFSFVLGNAPANEVWIDKVAMDIIPDMTSTSMGPVMALATSKPGGAA